MPLDLSLLDAFPRAYEIEIEEDDSRVAEIRPTRFLGVDPSSADRGDRAVILRPREGATWVGRCWVGARLVACPDPHHLLVWSDDEAFFGDVRDPDSFRGWAGWPLLHVLVAPTARRLIGMSWGRFWALGPDGPIWECDEGDRVHYMHSARLEGDVLRVVGESPPGPWWQVRFDVATGAIRSREQLPGPPSGKRDPVFP